MTRVEELTGFPECLDGRVKTLHPVVHAGILADRRLESHRAQLDELGVEPFDLVVSNLYPFADTVASGATPDECVEQIDIGGPSMVRAAAKNHPSVAIVTSPARYPDVLAAVADGGFTLAERKRLAAEAFAHTAAYDVAVASWCAQELAPADDWWPEFAGQTLQRAAVLRYGENAHQSAALYLEDGAAPGLAHAEQLHGKEMSYNNYVDAAAAYRAAYDHDRPAVAIIKHTNPCGIAVGADVADAHRKAHACDPVSAFGGVIATNATGVGGDGRAGRRGVHRGRGGAGLRRRRGRGAGRQEEHPDPGERATRARAASSTARCRGGVLVQTVDRFQGEGDDPAAWRLVSGAAASEEMLADLAFAWRACRAVKSNAILLAAGGASVGVGMGQVNRVDSARLAVARAGERSVGSVAASDAFFPFADGLEILLDAGVRAVVQPGGSVRDEEVVAAAQAAGVTMYLTGTRHFAH